MHRPHLDHSDSSEHSDSAARHGLIVTGTNTGVGKTLVSAALMSFLDWIYWKPVQSGTADGDDDTASVQQWAELPAERVLAPRYSLAAPLSPDQAARREGIQLHPDDFALPQLTPQNTRPLLIEGAGGVLVPLNENTLLIDLFVRWQQTLQRPVLVVASSALGTINHTLLTLEALQRRDLAIVGVILNGEPRPENAEAITRHSGVPVLAQLPQLERVDTTTVKQLGKHLQAEKAITQLRLK